MVQWKMAEIWKVTNYYWKGPPFFSTEPWWVPKGPAVSTETLETFRPPAELLLFDHLVSSALVESFQLKSMTYFFQVGFPKKRSS